jgi:hypothetical protein
VPEEFELDAEGGYVHVTASEFNSDGVDDIAAATAMSLVVYLSARVAIARRSLSLLRACSGVTTSLA